MSWITFIWSLAAGICLTLAGVHLLVWLRTRESWANLFLSLSAAGASGCLAVELVLMYSQTAEQFSKLYMWYAVPLGLAVVSLVWFTRLYLRAGRTWLAWLICALRALGIVIAFVSPPSANFREITSLQPISFLGETVSVPIGVISPWAYILKASALFWLAFLLDAVITAWRQGSRGRAMVLGAAMSVTIILGVTINTLMLTGNLSTPYTNSLPYLTVVLVVGYQLSSDLVRSARISRELQQNQERMRMAASAANMGLWEWDIEQDTFWLNDISLARLGVGTSERLTFNRFLESVHPDEREPTRQAMLQALEGGGDFEWEYRVLAPDGATRLISARGQVKRDAKGKPLLLRGVSMDITERKKAESERIHLRNELAHVQRVSTMGQLASALAHELNQPLGAILNNASTAQILSSQGKGGNTEFGEILADIIADATRAGHVIRRTRGIFKKGEPKFEKLDLNVLIEEVVELYRNVFNIEKVSLSLDLQTGLAPIRGDRVHLQQVLMNLINNATKAMGESSSRTLGIRSTMQSPDTITVSVSDSGTGIDEAKKDKLFEPFFTTKQDGLGMGLRICQSIIEELGGRIWVENNPVAGATFSFSLKAHGGGSG